jgi:hypothetical protein
MSDESLKMRAHLFNKTREYFPTLVYQYPHRINSSF